MTEGKHPLELLADWLEAREDHRMLLHNGGTDDLPRAQERMIAARARVHELDPAALRALALSATEAP